MKLWKLATGPLLCICALAAAPEALAARQVGNITIYSACETAALSTETGGGVYLDFPGARRWELATGQREWFPMPVEEVVTAVEEIGFPVNRLHIDIVILHVPRVGLVESSAEGSVIFLTPGRVAYPVEHVHYTTVHEVGHAVHAALMPDRRRDLWREYALLRGFDPAAGPHLPHASRPHEIFAEDFRALFGGDLAAFGGRVENHDLPPPAEVEGLLEFFLSLPERADQLARVSASPNPSPGDVVLRAPWAEDLEGFSGVRVFDLSGRLVRRLGPDGSAEVAWDGLDASGAHAAPGAYVVTGTVGGRAFSEKVIRLGR